ncbi:c-type cytochrome biogenesis protein CcsB [Corynebacterium heidelbergense]|uniref:C-type cytochrome biogenesis protein CcsB n=1 Tax=Corynebacterium heidelbergense TaxID=2055947 RepID=A0A364V9Q9_9CORY|nr:c-type cytochrome biogenesis protein CcsB [Corynebacterium heidelbergense]RAV33357.1 c-type cytochrome biogenesis protein CcsB [Corynebacterium heidelbergense]WCZ37382.1 Cytochrome c biogenesis protein CcsA [Corynebacterium heidelbergense]
MIIDQDLAQFSDVAFKTAVVLYLLALAVSLVYYGMVRTATEARRERAALLGAQTPAASAEARLGAPEKVLVGSGGGGVHNETNTEPPAADTVSALASPTEESALPARLQADAILRKIGRADRLGGVTQALVLLAIAVHAAHLILRGVSAQRFPWGNLFEYVSVVSLFAMIVSTIVLRRKAMRVMWPWILTPIVALLFYGGAKLYAQTAPVVPALQSHWFVVHVSTVSIGASIGLVSGMASIMYLVRKAQPRGQEKGLLGVIAGPLPDAAKLDALAYRSAVWALPIFGLGVVFGAIWAEAAWSRFWGWDPKETVSFITWILYAAYLHARATPGWRGSRSAWINVLAFATMVFNLFFINMVVSGLHSYAGLN